MIKHHHYLFIMLIISGACIHLRGKTIFPANHPYLRYTGRIDKPSDGTVRFDWPGVILETCFSGTSIAITLQGSSEYYGVFIDTVLFTIIKTSPEKKTYTLAYALTDTIHYLKLVKRFETDRTITEFTDIILDDHDTLAPPPQQKPFFIEYIGASTIMGYGNESRTTTCDSLTKLSNIHLSYGPISARLCNADYTISAKTRAGIVRNYNKPFITSERPFPFYYQRTLLSDTLSKAWKYTRRSPDVIVITLGINDYSTPPHPPRELFINHYFAFTQELYSLYPDVHLLCVSSWREPLRSYVASFVNVEQKKGNNNITFFFYKRIPDWQRGCDWHPNVKAHELIGKQIAEVIKLILD